MSASRIADLAERLLDEGLVDNETDARLAAAHILAAADRRESPDRPTRWADTAGRETRGIPGTTLRRWVPDQGADC